MEKGNSERVLRWELMAEFQGALVGRVIAVDMVNEMLLDMVHRLDLGVAGDEALRARTDRDHRRGTWPIGTTRYRRSIHRRDAGVREKADPGG